MMTPTDVSDWQSLALADFRIDLQMFAAEDEGRTEEGSERRRREERDKGNVPRSQELPSALVLLTSLASIYLLGGFIFEKCFLLFRRYFENIPRYSQFGNEEMRRLFLSAASDLMTIFIPVVGMGFLVAIAGNIVQVGFLFSPGAASFNFSRIAPNFKRVLPTGQTFFNLAKALAKVILIGWISYIIISMDFYSLLMSGNMGVKAALALVMRSAFKIMLTAGIVFFVISIFDFYYQRFQFEESIKMTPSEAKQELKESEGDRSILNRRRQMVREFIRKGMIQRVPKADVIIVNPTHYSVALIYDPAIHFAPVVTAKGADELALLIRRLARKHNVPIVEDRVQARLLYDEVEVDEPIPAKFFRAISLIIARFDKYRRVV